MKDTLTVAADKAAGMWTVTFSDPAIVETMGTATLPTPYTLAMPLGVVLSELQARNPDSMLRVVEA